MADKRVEFHEDAAVEYEKAVGWYIERSELAAQKFTTELSQAVENVAKAPQRWLVIYSVRADFSFGIFPLPLSIVSFHQQFKSSLWPTDAATWLLEDKTLA